MTLRFISPIIFNGVIYNYGIFVKEITEYFIPDTLPVYRVRLADGKLFDVFAHNCEAIKGEQCHA